MCFRDTPEDHLKGGRVAELLATLEKGGGGSFTDRQAKPSDYHRDPGPIFRILFSVTSDWIPSFQITPICPGPKTKPWGASIRHPGQAPTPLGQAGPPLGRQPGCLAHQQVGKGPGNNKTGSFWAINFLAQNTYKRPQKVTPMLGG